jgi:hypothetical protein
MCGSGPPTSDDVPTTLLYHLYTWHAKVYMQKKCSPNAHTIVVTVVIVDRNSNNPYYGRICQLASRSTTDDDVPILLCTTFAWHAKFYKKHQQFLLLLFHTTIVWFIT